MSRLLICGEGGDRTHVTGFAGQHLTNSDTLPYVWMAGIEPASKVFQTFAKTTSATPTVAQAKRIELFPSRFWRPGALPSC